MRTLVKSAMLATTLMVVALDAPRALAADPVVLTVDIGRVFTDSAAGKSGSAQISAKYQAQLQTAGNNFNAAATAYNTQVEAARKVVKPDGSLPPVNQQSLERAQQTLQQADSTLSRMQDEVNAVGSYVQHQIVDKVTPIAEQVRAQRKAGVVLARGSTLAADPADDITTTVIQSLDQQMQTVSIVPPQQGGAASGARSATPSQGR